MAKVHLSYRLKQETIDQTKELAQLLSRSEAVIIEEAVNAYYSRRKELFEEDTKNRLNKLK
ncbi:hypothetical protein [Larkinella terrae]|uniref:Ribbon-helix-helix protein, CopG family n=1 Tax=Larkinella terrae TaxID=2025311 RepID=A0A7K0EIG9_9BACT|nr:hypothetical protein [Larkinella terrae]MRS61643.1 hypothetical protein [Larkinella terrae]